MTDFEDRLTGALRSAGDDAPDATGLATAARRRMGVRRRRTALTSAAAVVAVAGTVGGVAMLGNGSGGSPQVSDEPTPTVSESSAAGKRAETWRDLSVTVPVGWGHGVLNDWCANGGELGTPEVERTGAISVDILCNPVNGYGVQFFDSSAADLAHPVGQVWQYEPGDADAAYPEGAWLGYQRSDHAMVLVVAAERAVAEEVLATASSLGPTDPDGNACLTRVHDDPSTIPPGLVRLCRYTSDGWLEQSEMLAGQDAVEAVAALDDAPVGALRRCVGTVDRTQVQVTAGDIQGILHLNTCEALAWNGEPHDLTADVLYWMLSPGWTGGVEGDVPMPTELRQ